MPGRVAVVAGLLVGLLAPSAQAKWAMPQERVPIERLLANVQRYTQAHPKDPDGFYMLGRLHSLAASGVQEQAFYSKPGDAELPKFSSHDPLLPYRGGGAGPDAELDAAIAAFDQALKLDPRHPLAWLGKAWCLQQRAERTKGSLQPAWDAYLHAFDHGSEPVERRGPGAPGAQEEAARSLAELAPRVPGHDPRVDAEVKAYQERLERTPRAITPVLLALDGRPELAPHLDPHARTHFDLDASRAGKAWPWLTPQAGLLAWDPDGCGQIRSGEQLFGSVSWWMFWRSGYQALAALDDDGDGSLSGEELRGLVVWVDRNGDGASDPGEVTDARAFGIQRLAVRPDGEREGVPWSARGALLRDGRALPSFDWTPQSVPEQPLAARRIP